MQILLTTIDHNRREGGQEAETKNGNKLQTIKTTISRRQKVRKNTTDINNKQLKQNKQTRNYKKKTINKQKIVLTYLHK